MEFRASQSTRILNLADGRAVGVAEFGDPAGRPLLALHGAPASRLMFDVADGAARRLGLKLFAPDRAGYGQSDPDRHPTLASRTDDLVQIVEALRLQRFGIVGISGGGPYAVSLAARLGSQRVGALALISPLGPVAECTRAGCSERFGIGRLHQNFFLKLLPRHSRAVEAASHLARRAFLAAPEVFGGVFSRLLGPPDSEVLVKPNVQASITGMLREALQRGVGGGLADLAIYGRDWGIDYGKVTVPCHLWQGTADVIVPPAASYYLAEQLPDCRLHRIEGAGHFWIYDHVEEVLGQVAAALPP